VVVVVFVVVKVAVVVDVFVLLLVVGVYVWVVVFDVVLVVVLIGSVHSQKPHSSIIPVGLTFVAHHSAELSSIMHSYRGI